MANYKGHVIGGIVAAGIVSFGSYVYTQGSLPDGGQLVADIQLLIGVFILSVLFALWPDVDTNSKAQDLFFGVAFVSDIVLIFQGQFIAAAFLGLLAMTPIVGSHRGWTHSRIAVLLVPSPILIIPYFLTQSVGDTAILLYAASVAGYLSHLLLDGLIFKWFRIKGGW